ncbi:hypothetical protein BS78_02G282600 [Paspalum vaginatum]|uniref:Uncharacterized protein n=1 Tax=Paspalum vaginatum TaxID=158149 RepID=A0A9W8CE39_9POAL|nr:hypothetical protein BS78_K074400 [Paspalum vaginatum]KAJ1290964.1 hypothetical protein BS78_02G282600 [Paspalum vaginatum]
MARMNRRWPSQAALTLATGVVADRRSGEPPGRRTNLRQPFPFMASAAAPPRASLARLSEDPAGAVAASAASFHVAARRLISQPASMSPKTMSSSTRAATRSWCRMTSRRRWACSSPSSVR